MHTLVQLIRCGALQGYFQLSLGALFPRVIHIGRTSSILSPSWTMYSLQSSPLMLLPSFMRRSDYITSHFVFCILIAP